ncbi:MAG: PGF-CTERM sorting domain-containing protein [Halobacteriota archaeon]|nr:PGF-CTERM sorting domain-containing protein [Halobacteriota archaeon]
MRENVLKSSVFGAVLIVLTVVILASSISISSAKAEEPVMAWNRTFGGAGDDFAKSVQQTSDGGFIVAGDTFSYQDGASDIFLVKTDSRGEKEWDRAFGGTGWDYSYSIQLASDGGYIVAGGTNSYGASDDLWLVKLNSSGEEEWNRTFGGDGDDYAYSLQQTSDGGFIVAGLTESFGSGGYDFWLVKTNSSGVNEWNRTFGGNGDDFASSVQETSDGGYIVAGGSNSYSGSNDFWLVKTNSSGVNEWNRTFGGNGDDFASSVQETSDGGFIVAGVTDSFGSGSLDFWLVKTDSSGDKEWDRTFGGYSIDHASSVKQTTDGGYIVAGYTMSFGVRSYEAWLVKTNSSGEKEWDRTFGYFSNDRASSVQETSDEGYIVAGHTTSFGAGDSDVWLMKVGGEEILEKEKAREPKIKTYEIPTETKRGETPGFKAAFAIIGLLTVAYFVRRR